MARVTVLLGFVILLLCCVCSHGKGLERSRKMKVSSLNFYFHDLPGGKNVTAVSVASAQATKTSPTGFGAMNVMDDPLTETPDINSKRFGYAQGIYTSSCQRELRLLMAATFVFQSGKYNGSTLAVLGNSNVFDRVREMPIVGGTGLFRLARGYTQARMINFDAKSGNAVVEYNVTVIHY